jgi:hypothetical protein
MATKLKIEKRGDEILKESSSFLAWWPSWLEVGINGHIFGREPSNDYFIKILFLLSKWFQSRRFLWEFPVGAYVKLSSAVGNSHKNLLLRNHRANCNKTLVE